MPFRPFLGILAVMIIAVSFSSRSTAAPSPSPSPVASVTPNPVLQALQNTQRAISEESKQLVSLCASLHAGNFIGAKADKRYPHSYLVAQVDCSLASYRPIWKRITVPRTQTPAPSST